MNEKVSALPLSLGGLSGRRSPSRIVRQGFVYMCMHVHAMGTTLGGRQTTLDFKGGRRGTIFRVEDELRERERERAVGA